MFSFSFITQDMRANPINLLLTSIAVADMLIMAEYIPFSVHMYIMKDRYETFEQKVRMYSIYLSMDKFLMHDLICWFYEQSFYFYIVYF